MVYKYVPTKDKNTNVESSTTMKREGPIYSGPWCLVPAENEITEKLPKQLKTVLQKHIIENKIAGTVKWLNIKSGMAL